MGNLVAPSVKNFQHSLMTVGQPLSPEGSLKIAQDQDVQKSLEHSSAFSLGSLGNPSSREVECDQSLGNPVSDKAPSTAHIFEQICPTTEDPDDPRYSYQKEGYDVENAIFSSYNKYNLEATLSNEPTQDPYPITEHTHYAENGVIADDIVIAYEDPRLSEGRVKKASLRTDPNLVENKVDQPPDEEESRQFEKFRVLEKALTIAQSRKLLRVLAKFNEVFAKNAYDLGCCNVGEHYVKTGDAQPIYTRARKVAPQCRTPLETELQELKELGIIEDTNSSWAAPIVLVKKKDGTIRLCIDFRMLNQVAERSSFPLPKINEIFAALQGMRFFSSLDLAKGFWQIKIAEEDRHKTAFITPYGQYQFNRLPFGLNSAPGAFQAIMTRVLGDLLWINCVVYVDDILIFTETFEEHLEVIDKVLTRLEKANLKIKLEKCEFARTQLHYLGHVINSLGIATDPQKVEAVKNWAPPNNVKELEQFLGTVNYYSKFIPEYSNMAAPLFKLKKKNVT